MAKVTLSLSLSSISPCRGLVWSVLVCDVLCVCVCVCVSLSLSLLFLSFPLFVFLSSESPCKWMFPGRNYKRPPPPFPPISARRPFAETGGGAGLYILKPPAAGFYTPPLFYTPPTPRRVFSGVWGWGCIKFGPVMFAKESASDCECERCGALRCRR